MSKLLMEATWPQVLFVNKKRATDSENVVYDEKLFVKIWLSLS